jgi:DNA-binding NarL/FixJ family response regulator
MQERNLIAANSSLRSSISMQTNLMDLSAFERFASIVPTLSWECCRVPQPAGDILSYLAAGVTGYILERSGQTEVERAVREILNGTIYIPPNVIEPAACEPDFAIPALRRNWCRLTPRQDGVLRLLLKGHSNKEIARQLNLSPHTVKIHVGALLRCFAVQKRSSLAVAAAALRAEGIGHCSPLGSSQMLQISV